MKYVLIEDGDGEAPLMRVFETAGERAIATRAAILGPPDDDNKDMECPDLLELATEGTVSFEGDPAIHWKDVLDVIIEPSANLNR